MNVRTAVRYLFAIRPALVASFLFGAAIYGLALGQLSAVAILPLAAIFALLAFGSYRRAKL